MKLDWIRLDRIELARIELEHRKLEHTQQLAGKMLRQIKLCLERNTECVTGPAVTIEPHGPLP